MPATEFAPETADELARFLRDNSAGPRRAIVPAGGRTALHYGRPVPQDATLLAMNKLVRVVDYPARDMTVTVEAGRKIVLRTGDLIVRGQPESAYWYPLQGEVRALSANPPLLNRARALFPGTYTVLVHTSVTVPDRDLGAVEVVAGRTTVLEH